MNPYYIFYIIGAFVVSALVNKFLLIYLHRKGVMDIPNERSSHKIPTPRGGGIGIMIGVFVCGSIYAAVEADFNIFLIILCATAIGIIGIVDDVRKGLHTGLRFGLQLLISLVIVWQFSGIDRLPMPEPMHFHMYYYGIIISVIWLMGITNIFNFLDGIDGYAGTQGLIAGIMVAVVSWGTPVSVIGMVTAMACAGFLLFNWHPAKIFMGDVGSSFLGFLFAALPFYLKDKHGVELRSQIFFATAIFLWFFLLDGTFTMIRRLVKGEKIWQAHRSHLYQRLVISGMKHNEVVLTVCFFYMILYAALLFYFIIPSGGILHWPIVITGGALFLVYLFYTMYRERKANEPKSAERV